VSCTILFEKIELRQPQLDYGKIYFTFLSTIASCGSRNSILRGFFSKFSIILFFTFFFFFFFFFPAAATRNFSGARPVI